MRLSIRYKIIIGYVLICIFSMSILNIIITKTMKVNNRKVISNELKELKEKTIDFTQNFYNDNVKSNTFTTENELFTMLRFLLSRYYNEYLIIYNSDKKKVAEFNPHINEDMLTGTSMTNIENNICSYDINYIDHKVIVDLPIQLTVNDENIGIVRYFIDYTTLITMEKKVQSIVFYFSFTLGILVVILSMINSNNIVKSILKFKDFVGKIGEDNSNEMLKVTSKDEIGELAKNINVMKKRIASQIDEIKKDKDQIQKISDYRKHFYENMTHELKTPLTTIIGYTELSIYQKTYNEENLKIINDECSRLYKLVTSILDMSYYGKNDIYRKKERFHINNLIDTTINKMQLKARKLKIDLKIDKNEHIELYGNKEGLRTILINLIDNSIKYNKENGSIFINSYIDKNLWIFVIEDTGIGISKENQKNMFKPFYKNFTSQTDNFDSSGLGLTIVKEIVKFHSGTIEVDSDLDNGTKIIINIPFN